MAAPLRHQAAGRYTADGDPDGWRYVHRPDRPPTPTCPHSRRPHAQAARSCGRDPLPRRPLRAHPPRFRRGHGALCQPLRPFRRRRDPAFTYCDVEAALQQWLLSVATLDLLAARLAAEREARERAELHRLLAKYGVPAEFRRLALPVVRRRVPRRSQ